MDAIRRFVCGDAIRGLFENIPSESDSNAQEVAGRSGTSSYEMGYGQKPCPNILAAEEGISKEHQSCTSPSSETEGERNGLLSREPCDSQLDGPAYNSNMPQSTTEKKNQDIIAMVLTQDFVSDVNTVLRYENTIASYTKGLDIVENQIQELEQLLGTLEGQISDIPEGEPEARSSKEKTLEFATNLLDEMYGKRHTLLGKLENINRKLEQPKNDLYGCLKGVLEKHDLLEDISGTSDLGHDDAVHENEQQASLATMASPEPSLNNAQPTIQPPATINATVPAESEVQEATQPSIPRATPSIAPSKSSSDMQRAAERRAKFALYDQKDRLGCQIDYISQRLDDWYLEYDDALRHYKDCFAHGETEDTRTVFDNKMFIKHRDIIQELIVAEKEIQEVVEEGRALGVDFEDDDQESHFLDYADDGYRISHEQEWIDDVDYHKIEKWMNGLPDDEPPSPLEGPEGEADDWNVREIEFGESISVIAEGKPRARIDRWRSSQKQDHMTRFVEDVDTELEYQHGQQKRRCKRSHSV
ncbi:hypothetical protein HYFRA_00013289 [Hymenoscyphus fraxineus]|uniref:Uncharacterized protein n=1 Tax=Hymenoscyphus fraxineus TaxID=746836 RepID=A0A9N9LAW9_9HELO|nr:hypothetical protein HYFRA_00013289 [Hymenoscyphus fraxineus]